MDTRGGRWVRTGGIAGVAALIISGGAVAVAAMGNHPAQQTLTAAPSTATTTPSTVPPTTAAPTSTTEAPLPPRPAVLVAASQAGRLVLIDSTTGRTTKVLATYQGTDGCPALGRVSLTPDASTVYFQRNFEDVDELKNTICRPEIHRMPTAGGSDQKFDDGFMPRVSPNGSQLAYFVPTGPSMNDLGGSLVTRNLATGKRTVVRTDVACGCDDTAFASWAPDSRHIAVQGLSCGCGGTSFMELDIVDALNPANPPVKVQAPPAIDSHAAWGDASYLPNGDLYLFEIGRYDFAKGGFMSNPRMLIVNPTSARIVKVVTSGYPDRFYQATDSDASGQHLLYISNGNLMASDDWARPSQLATGLVSADW
jgi:hypothetical protein